MTVLGLAQDLDHPAHRGLMLADGWFHLVGGMTPGRMVTGRAVRFRLIEADTEE